MTATSADIGDVSDPVAAGPEQASRRDDGRGVRAATRWRLVSEEAGTSSEGRSCLARRGPTQLVMLQQRLHAAATLPDLFTRAAALAPAECGFARAVVLSVRGRELSAGALHALDDPASDLLRRRLLADPLTLAPGSVEAEFIRLAEGGRGETAEGRSVLQERYGLHHFALGAIAPEGEVLALLVVDRARRPVEFQDRRIVQGFAQLLTYSVERLLLRQRMTEFGAELRYMMSSTQALLGEARDAPLSLPVDSGAGQVFTTRLEQTALPNTNDLRELLTRREWSVAKELVAGKSNPEIATALQISPETVKQYVSRVMRKVGAANRAEAAVRCVRLAESVG